MHAAARVIFDLKPRDHVTAALKTLHLLPVKYRIQFTLSLLVHLAINKRAPTDIQDLLTTTASIPVRASNRSNSNNDLIQQSTRLKLGEHAFYAAAPASGIDYPLNAKLRRILPFFKRNLKTFLFQSAYPNSY